MTPRMNDNDFGLGAAYALQKNLATNGRFLCALLVLSHLWFRFVSGPAYETGLGAALAVLAVAFAYCADASLLYRLPAALAAFFSIASVAAVGASLLLLLAVVW
jgi:hypothetical protein